MTNRTNVSVLMLLAALLVAIPVAQAQQPPISAPDNDFILRGSAAEIAGVLARHGLTEVGRLASAPPGEEVCLVRAASAVSPEQVIADITAQEPSVTAIEEVFLASLPETYQNVTLNQAIGDVLGALGDTSTVLFDKDSTGTDRNVWTGYVEQDADGLVRASSARTLETGDGAIVAIIDTGVDPGHPLLDPHLVPGYDFLLDQAGDASEIGALDESTMVILDESTMVILDDLNVVALSESTMVILDDDQASALDPAQIPAAFGHGTMVAGIVHLVAPDAKIMPLRAFDSEGRASVFDVVRAIYYAVDQGATVINMSFSIEIPSQELIGAIDYADQNGVTIVASVGNEGLESMVFPAGLCNVFGVGSTDVGDYVSSFSNLGNDLVTLTAPGENVITVYPGGGWASASGTSFAAPWISGTVALLADAKGDGSAGSIGFSQIDDALSYADTIFGSGAAKSGDGRIDIRSALDNMSQLPATGSSSCSGSNNAFPIATIAAPVVGALYTEGDSVTFTGTASDVEDGDLTAGLVWTSDLDGSIGSGGSFSAGALSVGTHTIMAGVTDSVLLSDSAAIILTVVSAPPTSGGSTVVQLTASQDSYIRMDSSDANYGDENTVRLKADSGKVRRSMIEFDVSSIPAATSIASAKLKVYVTRAKSGVTVNLHRITRSWVEGTGNTGTGADWNTNDGSQAWANPGGDLSAAVLGSLSPDTKNVWIEVDVTALVQAWVDGLLINDGVLLDPTGGNGEIKFGSRESVGKEPLLQVAY